MVRPLRKTHIRLWLLLGPLLVVMVAAVLLTRGQGAIPASGDGLVEAPGTATGPVQRGEP